jgi:EAL domain-containing protein (putative c-di-GMP-specific phosphodiesterase class I)
MAERDPHTDRRLALITDLRQGIDGQEFRLDYQPILHLTTGIVLGVESLLRWDHRSQGRLPPAEFIDLAEHTGPVNALTAFALTRALDEWAPVELPLPLTVNVNLSPRNLHDPHLPTHINELLHAHHVPASRLALEITESQIMADLPSAMTRLTQLHEMGVSLVLDDFGTGYSSLALLRRLPVGALKIDKAFILALDSLEDEAIVRFTIDLGHHLGLSVIAEGVESQTVQDRLQELGCDAAQGYFISVP